MKQIFAHFKLYSWQWSIFFLTFFAFFTRFWMLGFPHAVVFDEYHFFKFVQYYTSGEYYFDIHPPLGKFLLLLGTIGSDISHYPFPENWEIGSAYEQTLNLWALRAVPAFFGALLIPIVFGVVYRITFQVIPATLAGILVLFDPALITESQYILMDSSLIFFEALALMLLLLFLQSKDPKFQWIYWVFLSFILALAVSTKWTGLSLVGVSGVVGMYLVWKDRDWKTFVLRGISMATIIGVIYTSIFALHFALLPYSGTGDIYHEPQFQSTLKGSLHEGKYEDPGFLAFFTELNIRMLDRNKSISSEHSFASTPLDWIVGQKPIFYWHQHPVSQVPEGEQPTVLTNISSFLVSPFVEPAPRVDQYDRKIYLFGNPFIWTIATFAVLMGLFLSFVSKNQEKYRYLPLLILVYGAHFFPFFAVERSAFLYHYLSALVVSFIIFSVIIGSFPSQLQRWWMGGISAFLMIFFMVMSPLMYGGIMKESELDILLFWL